MRIRWRNVAIVSIVLCIIWAWYSPPPYLAGILVPDHIDRERTVGDPTAFCIAVLGILAGFLLLVIESGRRDR